MDIVSLALKNYNRGRFQILEIATTINLEIAFIWVVEFKIIAFHSLAVEPH